MPSGFTAGFFFFVLIWFLNITIVISISAGSIFITWKWRRRLAYNIMPLWKWINIFNCCLIDPWIHTLWIYSWVFFVWWFLHITIVISVFASSVFITWKWRRWLTYNIMPLRKRIDIFNCCLINPRIHALWIDSWIFFLVFSFKLMKAAWGFICWSLRFWNTTWTWRSIWSWKFIIKHTLSYKLPYFWSYFFMSNIVIFFIILEIKSSSFWIWINILRISSSYCSFWI